MPWKWIPPETDKTLPVLVELPHWAHNSMPWIKYEFDGIDAKGHFHQFYHCRHCGGYIEGTPYEEHEHSLGLLSGRSGRVVICRRCGREIDFQGAVS